MSYSVKVVVYLADEPKLLAQIQRAVKVPGVRVKEITLRTADPGSKEAFLDLLLEASNTSGVLLRRIERIRGAAVMAATEPKELPASRKGP
jgi:acetolactate synthase regulatory subunit